MPRECAVAVPELEPAPNGVDLGALLPALLSLLPEAEEAADLHPPGPAAPSMPRRATVDVRTLTRTLPRTLALTLTLTLALALALTRCASAATARAPSDSYSRTPPRWSYASTRKAPPPSPG